MSESIDFRDIPASMHHARRVLEIAAAGGHNLWISAPSGTGAILLARRLPSILPDIGTDEGEDMDKVYQAARMPPPIVRPFRAPHHTCSTAALCGGGAPLRPGELCLAHGGVLFLDEIEEFRLNAIQVTASFLRAGSVVIQRSGQRSVAYPARPLLVVRSIDMRVGSRAAPLAALCDLHLPLRAWPYGTTSQGEASAAIRQRVTAARARLATMPPIGGANPPRVVRLARTIAALDGDPMSKAHIREAFALAGACPGCAWSCEAESKTASCTLGDACWCGDGIPFAPTSAIAEGGAE